MWAHNRPHATGHQFHFDSDNEGMTGTSIRNPICSLVIYLSSNDTGGPSIVTNQRLQSRLIAEKCWFCYPNMRSTNTCTNEKDIQNNSTSTEESNVENNKINNNNSNLCCVFEGNLLHGVVPGKPMHITTILPENNNDSVKNTSSNDDDDHRVTVMFAFWRRIRVRDTVDDGKEYGAARLLPTQPEWAQQLRQQYNHPIEQPTTNSCVIQIDPIYHDRVYEMVGGDNEDNNNTPCQPWTKKMGFPEYDQIFQGF
jgi:hypothetical protein